MFDMHKIAKNDSLLEVSQLKEVLWINNNIKKFSNLKSSFDITLDDIYDAEKRLNRFSPLIKSLFPETSRSDGIIESEIRELFKIKKELENYFSIRIDGRLLIKMDNDLPIAGSVKARGGIYEVLQYTEKLAINNGLVSENEDYSILNSEKCRSFFNQYTIEVGSTGNLGLSIGIMSSKIGYKAIVHMSNDAKQWKKDLLRSYGVKVIEYESDYSEAVKIGRAESDANPMSYFVDDENSINLFLGYSVAALRLQKQLKNMNIAVNSEHPLFVYIPCGIGGAPGGITFGLKNIFGDNVHCFFVEPTHAPCMLVGMATGLDDKISVHELGIDGKTEADGLAVGRPSKLVGKYIDKILSGIFTIGDEKLYAILKLLYNSESIKLEPSACAAFQGILQQKSNNMIKYLAYHNLENKTQKATHIVWSTGGSMVPDGIYEQYLKKGELLLQAH